MRRPLPTERLDGLLDATTGLTSAQAQAREARYGPNRIVEAPPRRWTELMSETARDPMIWFLAATALLFAWLGDFVEAGVLAFALLPIAGMDAYLYRRTRASTEGLASRLATVASAIRDGNAADLPSTELVPGDLVVVTEGGAFPADGVLVAGHAVQADESALTGEAMPVRKVPLAGHLDGGAEIAVDDVHWGFAGTRVLTGEARLRVVFTGAETIYGEIVRSAQAGRHERTPLQRSLDSLVKILVVAALAICAALAVTRFLGGHGIVDAVVSAVTLAVAALPEEFPVVFAFYLGVGTYRLARRQALVRRAVVVENIGRVTCICSDKTGTLTEGRLELAHVVAADDVADERLLAVAATASRPGGDPLDAAILAASVRVDGETLATFPFTEDRRRECAALRTPSGDVLCAAKGAPETIFSMTTSTAEQRSSWLRRTQELAATGHKVIACAERSFAPDTWSGAEPDGGYTLSGVLAFEDPIREGAASAVASARAAGIHVLMVTGDHPATAHAVAVELGIGGAAPRVVEGNELEPLLEDRHAHELRQIDVIARAAPAQKLELVRALQRSGEIVAVTGDGVNDVPALQGADVGIAMGERGTRSAREVAAIVLLDDNFRTIVRAIAEGRQLFRNLRLSFAYLLMVHIPLVLTAALIPFAGFPLLYLPAHIVWLELIIHPTAIFAFQQAVPSGALGPAGRSTQARFFDRRDWLLIGGVGIFLTVALTVAYLSSAGPEQTVEHARAMAIAVLVIGSAAVTLGLSRMGGVAARIAAAATALSAVVLIQVPPLARLLHLEPLHAGDWAAAALSGLAAGLLAAALVHK